MNATRLAPSCLGLANLITARTREHAGPDEHSRWRCIVMVTKSGGTGMTRKIPRLGFLRVSKARL
jgi:hypothetical protein